MTIFFFLRQGNPYYDTSDNDADIGIENTHSAEMYEYSDKPRISSVTEPVRTNSASSFRTDSVVFSKDTDGFMSSSSFGEHPRKGTPLMATKRTTKNKTYPVEGVPQTDV